MAQNNITPTWVEIIKLILQNLGGTGTLSEIYDECLRIKHHLTPHYQSTIRCELQRYSSDCRHFKGQEDFFRLNGKGCWSLR